MLLKKSVHTIGQKGRKLLMVLVGLLMAAPAWSEDFVWTMPYDWESSRTITPGNTYTIYDDGGPTGNYSLHCHGSIVLNAPEGYVMHFTGSYTIIEGIDALKLFDTLSTNVLFAIYTGLGTINATSTSNHVKVEFFANYHYTIQGFELHVELVPVEPGNYSVEGCFNYTFLEDTSMTTCTYGSFSNPDQNEGYLFGRHTIITDTSTIDPHSAGTDHPLRAVPPGYAASVRLGNDGTGAQAERITYAYTVDTTIHDMLIMRYAAVLEDPGHDASEQPKLTYRFTDENGNELNSACYSANFTASASLGWHSFWHGSEIQGWYCDWTPVSVDLAPLHGQTIYIELTTYDCAEQGHFGYAYFVFTCTDKFFTSTSCGDSTNNTFTAPEGFTYTWRHQSSNTVVGHDRTIHVTTPGTYTCTLHPPGSTGNSCDLLLEVEAGSRYPYSQFVYRFENGPCDGHVHFTNRSVVSRNAAHTQLTTERCESHLWDFGDGTTSTQMNPSHYFPAGTYNVSLTAMLADGQCRDTMTQQVVVVAPRREERTVELCQGDYYLFYDSVLFDDGTYVYSSSCLTSTLHLSFVDTKHTVIRDTVTENQLPWSFMDWTFDHEVEDSIVNLIADAGCDSLVHYNLVIHWNQTVDKDTVTCENLLPITWNGFVFDAAGTLYDTLQDQYGADSIVRMSLWVWPSYDISQEVTIDEGGRYIFGNEVFENAGTYEVHLQTQMGCDSLVRLVLSYRRKSIYAPNVFTPDLLENNTFFLTGENLLEGHVWVYERRGLIVANFDLIEGCWDGTHNGVKVPQGTYVWLCKYRATDHPGELHVVKGLITLLR